MTLCDNNSASSPNGELIVHLNQKADAKKNIVYLN